MACADPLARKFFCSPSPLFRAQRCNGISPGARALRRAGSSEVAQVIHHDSSIMMIPVFVNRFVDKVVR